MMEGTIEYFFNHLQATMMNRLVDEQAQPLNLCYRQLLEQIYQSDEPTAIKKKQVANLEKAYQLVLKETVKVEEITHIG